METDTLGYPVIACRKCAGHGTIPAYHSIHHGTCYACNGSRRTYPTTQIKMAAQTWAADVTASTKINSGRKGVYFPAGDLDMPPNDVHPGMVIRQRRSSHVETDPWRTVATVRDTAEIVSGHLATPGAPTLVRDRIVWWMGSVITFTDGSTIRIARGCPDYEAQPDPTIVAAARADADKRRTRYLAAQARKTS